MSIEHHNWGTIFTGEDVHVYRIHALRLALQMEMRGIKLRRGVSVYANVKREFGLRGNRQSVYDQFCHMHNLKP